MSGGQFQADFMDKVVEGLLDCKIELIQDGGSLHREHLIAGTGMDHPGSERWKRGRISWQARKTREHLALPYK